MALRIPGFAVDSSMVVWAEPGKGVSIVFAGNRYFSKWSAGLGDFYVRSGGSRGAAIEDARVKHLSEVLKRVESVDVTG